MNKNQKRFLILAVILIVILYITKNAWCALIVAICGMIMITEK